MTANWKKSIGSAIALVVFGLIALSAGAKWLVVLIPAAMLVWFSTGPAFRNGRN